MPNVAGNARHVCCTAAMITMGVDIVRRNAHRTGGHAPRPWTGRSLISRSSHCAHGKYFHQMMEERYSRMGRSCSPRQGSKLARLEGGKLKLDLAAETDFDSGRSRATAPQTIEQQSIYSLYHDSMARFILQREDENLRQNMESPTTRFLPRVCLLRRHKKRPKDSASWPCSFLRSHSHCSG
jgi:hypothetical protein